MGRGSNDTRDRSRGLLVPQRADQERLGPVALRGAVIIGKLELAFASIGDCSLSDCLIQSAVDTMGATFTGVGKFGGATFTGNAGFDKATFTGNVARFDEATFTGDARFDGATFTGNVAWFARATFTGDAAFAEAVAAEYEFKGAQFHGELLGPWVAGSVGLAGAVFHTRARVAINAARADCSRLQAREGLHLVLRGCRVDLSDAEFLRRSIVADSAEEPAVPSVGILRSPGRARSTPAPGAGTVGSTTGRLCPRPTPSLGLSCE